MKAVFYARSYGRFTKTKNNFEEKKLHRTNQGLNSLGGIFSKWDNVRAPIQFRRERQSQHLKRLFFLTSDPLIFTSLAPEFLAW